MCKISNNIGITLKSSVFFHIRPFTRRSSNLPVTPRGIKTQRKGKETTSSGVWRLIHCEDLWLPWPLCNDDDTCVIEFQREQGCPSHYWSNESQIYDKRSFILASPLPDFKGLARSCIDENVSVLQRAAILTEQWRLTERCQRSKADKSITVANYKYGWTIFCARTGLTFNNTAFNKHRWTWFSEQNRQSLNAKQQLYYNTQGFLSSAVLIACQAHHHKRDRLAPEYNWCVVEWVMRWLSMSPPAPRQATRLSRVHLSAVLI